MAKRTAPKNRPSTVRPSSSATKCLSDASWNAATGRCSLGWVSKDASSNSSLGFGSSHRMFSWLSLSGRSASGKGSDVSVHLIGTPKAGMLLGL
ncbi:hypothetical protein IGI04_000934 [Brassica rapa subsp. trilocularis]|uniref:Uncharacterized protein n=1 Tax=Brassica rapa subsp. trilocularis TaxID=1813537 RepID=A0ABQ7NR73_BRACM|nr:hypothetical protein IGI04_000934 [Brassica rapa subsp. trilocularis]